MGSYKDKLSYEERWQVIHYIRSLQAKELKLEYNQLVNTLNSVDRPAGITHKVEVAMEEIGGHHHIDGSEHESHDGIGDHSHEGEGHDTHGHDSDHHEDDKH